MVERAVGATTGPSLCCHRWFISHSSVHDLLEEVVLLYLLNAVLLAIMLSFHAALLFFLRLLVSDYGAVSALPQGPTCCQAVGVPSVCHVPLLHPSSPCFWFALMVTLPDSVCAVNGRFSFIIALISLLSAVPSFRSRTVADFCCLLLVIHFCCFLALCRSLLRFRMLHSSLCRVLRRCLVAPP